MHGRSRDKKRRHEQFDRDTRPNEVGTGTALEHPQNPQPDPMSTNAKGDHGSDSDEWKLVTRGNKKQKKNNYPALSYSNLHRLESCVKLGDLQSLVLYCLADGTSPQWVSVRHHNMVKKAVVLFVPGLEQGMFDGTVNMSQLEEKPDESWHEPEPNVEPDSHLDQDKSRARTSSSPANSSSKQPQKNNENDYHARSSADKYVPSKLEASWLPEPLEPLAEIFEHVWPIRASGDDRFGKVHSPLQAMLQSPLTRSAEEKKYEKHGRGSKPSASGRYFESKRTPIPTYVMSTEELQDNEYILHPVNFHEDERENQLQSRVESKQSAADGWIDARVLKFEDNEVPDQDIEQGSLLEGRRVLAMDCEMCQVEGDQLALTRISLVDWDGSVVMDQLVKPDLPITNYLTQFSGITAAKLDPVTTTLAEIQQRLLDILKPHTILVGHSLNADLVALKLTHPFIIDTAVIYPHPRGPPLKSSLKYLAQKYLNREIQKGHGHSGHDSIEDALACLDLIKLKGEKGPDFGTTEATNEPIFKRLKRALRPGSTHARDDPEGRIGAIIDHGHPERSYGQMANYSIGCTTDTEIVANVQRAVLGDPDGAYIPGGGVDFTWARLRELEALRGWRNDDPSATAPGTDPEPEALAAAVTQTVARISEIRAVLPPCTLLIVYSGTGDPRDMVKWQKVHRRYKREFQTLKWDDLTTKWTDVEEQALRRGVRKARMGVGFVAVT